MHDVDGAALAESTSAQVMIWTAVVAGMAQAGTCDLHQTERVARRLAEVMRETHPAASEFIDTFVALLDHARPDQ
jgi:hypothetical protein